LSVAICHPRTALGSDVVVTIDQAVSTLGISGSKRPQGRILDDQQLVVGPILDALLAVVDDGLSLLGDRSENHVLVGSGSGLVTPDAHGLR
jgi:hypothetical protein